MQVEHWYHVWAAGEWREPLAEHLWFLDYYGYDAPFNVGIIGTPEQRDQVLHELYNIRKPTRIIQRARGWEQPTLRALHREAQYKDCVVLYAHTKGAHDPTRLNHMWRQSMTSLLLDGWRDHAALLKSGEVDAVGSHWLSPEEYGENTGSPLPCFGGNFWMASTAYLRTLPVCRNDCRHDAEAWLGLNGPKVRDLKPGWPGHYHPVKCGRIIAGAH